MPHHSAPSAILLIHCPDRPGLVAAVAEFIRAHNGNILHFDQHVDAENQVFFMRAEWDLAGFDLRQDEIGERFQGDVAGRFGMLWELHFSDETPRMAIFVSTLPHCLYDLLARCQSGEWRVAVPLIVSNHASLERVARQFDIDYRHIPVTADARVEQERKVRDLIDAYNVDFAVLARYMQILSPEFVAAYPNRIINIHHSFLPAFPGARPYHSAHARGVKVIGATSHYVTAELDGGPIIEQDVVRVSHRDSVDDMVRKGRDLEKLVLARAVWYHLQRRVLVYGNRTVVFA